MGSREFTAQPATPRFSWTCFWPAYVLVFAVIGVRRFSVVIKKAMQGEVPGT